MPSQPTPGNPRTLLLTIDAFGTIFHPRDPVPHQYASAAHRFGLPRATVTPDRLQSAFKAVFKAQSQAHPNYGRAQALRGEYGGPRQWWEEVIRGSFARVLDAPSSSSATNSSASTPTDSTLPDGLVQHLLDRFACRDGYVLDANADAFFTRLRHLKSTKTRLGPFDRVVVGVVSNSDDRVPAVLESLGLRVGMCRADQDVSSTQLPGFEIRGPRDKGLVNCHKSDETVYDLDLVITSYEAGAEKPSPIIFEVARRQAMKLVGASEEDRHGSDGRSNWTCVHVGDDYDKDYRAAIDAGWKAFYIPLEDVAKRPSQGSRTGSLLDVISELQRFE
ncbi:putative haloacid dehalogenase-like hydrolase [Aspergillus uvarum CBS 121591]|uniref:Putative haloacid dehalogenase-like hydrolase n=1 Tax=Aspergillus uvarum CBS 121591 TaxID=1448315 RepID=A0A319BV62_9EURO|nr:putative haloacid dehalogenase-like hydrolase [Aspergillus uvarum CBS 121591]PYH76504.1 putative haloacid dehalogenase-like hydrolase [Aspergillus uvarum CBS 121591]